MTILYSGLFPSLDQIQAEDQAGFRSSYQTTDHLATYRMIDQKCHEWWNQNVGRDNRLHEGVRLHHTTNQFGTPSKSCGIEHDYIHFLKKLYRDQKATVLTDEESDMFEIKKGTKQGDPLSSLLFNTVLQKASEEDIPRWQKKRGTWQYVLSDNDHDCLTNMRFADDVLLFASSKEQLQNMLCEFKRSTEKVGLRIHPGKTKILSNQSLSNIRKEIEIDDIKVGV